MCLSKSCRLPYPTAVTSCLAKALELVHPPASRPGQLRAACKGRRAASSPTRCAVTTSKAVRPAKAAHLGPLSLVCGGMRIAVRCHSGGQGTAAGCACSAITRACARGARRSEPHKRQPQSVRAFHRAQPRPAGCGRMAQRPQRRLPSWASRSLILGRCERCLVGSGCFLVCHLLRMQECRHAEACKDASACSWSD